MPNMTPIKEVWVVLTSILFLDYADGVNLVAQCVDEETALAMGLQFGLSHGKETYHFKPSHRRMVPVGGSN